MKILNIIIREKIATNPNPEERIVCDNSDYSIKFDFDEEWEEHHIKTARFIFNGSVAEIIFEGDTVNVPKIINAPFVAVGVFAGDLRTTTAAYIKCDLSVLSQDGPPADPPPDVYAQIVKLFEEKCKVLEEIQTNFVDVSEVAI